MHCTVVIPAYQPDNSLIKIVDELIAEKFDILVINDGSGEAYDDIFRSVEGKATVISNPQNMGKGYTLKHGFSKLRELFPECEGFITADSDGQHLVKDIVRVRQELEKGSEFVLTVRQRKNKIPFRSRFGNDLSKIVYTILTGHYFQDNQSGLRGFLIDNVDWLTKVGGNKYDYEMNMLFYADKQGISITTIMIEAIYFDGNATSHFSPLQDTLRIYRTLFASAVPTIVTALLIEASMLFFSIVFGYRIFYINVPSIGIAGSFICMTLYRFGVFRTLRYQDGLRTLIYTVFRFSVYTLGVFIFHLLFDDLILFINFNMVVVLEIIPEYLLHKAMHVSSYKDVNKEVRL